MEDVPDLCTARGPHEETNLFAVAMAGALGCLDGNGRLTKDHAVAVRRATANTPARLRLDVGCEPERYFGPFDSLPLETRHSIVEAIVKHDQWRMAWRELGILRIATIRCLQTLRLKLRRFRRSRRLLGLIAEVLRSGPSRAIYSVHQYRLFCEGKLYRRPTLSAILSLTGLQPRNLAVCYARSIRQLTPYRALSHDRYHHNSVGVVLGIDLIPTANGCYYLESNLDCDLIDSQPLYDNCEPTLSNLMKFMTRQGFRHLVIMANSSRCVNSRVATQLQDVALARKVRLTIIEDSYLSNSRYAQSFGIPLLRENDTLVVRVKYYRTSLDYLLHHKDAANRALRIYKQYSSDPALLIPDTGFEPVLDGGTVSDPFPNLVYKLPDSDIGRNIIFLKALSADHARWILDRAVKLNRAQGIWERLQSWITDSRGLFQAYVRSRLLPDRRLYIVRAYLLITPLAIEFLSAKRVVSRHSVPEDLPPGVVQDPRPYLANTAWGSECQIVPLDEEVEVKTAALAAAKGFLWAAAYGFQMSVKEMSEL